MDQRQIRRLANKRAALMLESCLNYGWEPDDLIAEIGQANVDRVAHEIGNIANELYRRVGEVSWSEQARDEARGEVPGRADPGGGAGGGLGDGLQRDREVRRGDGATDRRGGHADRGEADPGFGPEAVEGRKYAVCPGWITSESDRNRRFIDFDRLVPLYGVKPEECLHIPPDVQDQRFPLYVERLTWLYPQSYERRYNEIREELERGSDAFKLD